MVQRAADEARRAERKRRHRMDDLRYALRKVPRIDVEMTYDEVSHVSPYAVVKLGIMLIKVGRAVYERFTRVQGYPG